MEKKIIQKNEQLSVERCVLLIYCIYSIVMTTITIESNWPVWLAMVFMMSYVVSLMVHLVQFRDYRFRAYLTASLMQLCIVFWSASGASLSMTVSALSAMAVMLGLYGIPEIIYIIITATTFLNFYYIFMIQEIDFFDHMFSQVILEIVSVYFVEIVMYILVKKRLENTERQMSVIASLKAAEHSKDDFMANVSHEIRTPINTICGMSEIILREELSEQVREDIFSIQTAGRSLLSIVSDVLDFSELQSNQMPLFEESYNITSTINDIVNMSMARKDERRVELIVDCNANIPSILTGDEQKIRRVIMNLVNNALKFTIEGCISIIIYARDTAYGINLIVRVKDTGIGMKEDSLEKLFTSFNQVDTRRNRQEGGIGLGLAISQAMVEKMGGFITIQSEYGKGSEVQFVIPQKVVDRTPIVSVRDPERLNVAVYIDMEQFERREIRDEYDHVISHMTRQLKVKSHVCQNLAELKRRVAREVFTHIFISILEYEEDREFFDTIAKTITVVAIIDRSENVRIPNKKIRCMYKPLFILPIVMLLNDEKIVQGMDENYYYRGRFLAPEASVLAVDDNLMNIRVLEGLLRPYKIKLAMATSGAEALEKIERMDYDLVFMDHMMPEMDGIEVMHRIRQKPGNYFKKIPIVALTANAIGGMREVFLSEGFQDFMAKPIEVSVLERVLKRNLPQEKLLHVEEANQPLEQDGAQAETQQITETETQQQLTTNETQQQFTMTEMQQSGILEGGQQLEQTIVSGFKNQRNTAPHHTDLPADCFNEQMGVRYCGNLQNYIEVLQLNSKGGLENQNKIQQFYDVKDWKNYTIYVHGLKSSMINIGVEKLSGMAKDLEFAGKRGDEAFILEHHDAMMSEYTRILNIMQKSKTLYPDAQQESTVEGNELQEAELDRLALDFEDAAFAFDEEQMLEIAKHLATCSYQAHSLKERMQPVIHKIEMSDYMSASEVISRLKDEICSSV